MMLHRVVLHYGFQSSAVDSGFPEPVKMLFG
jgi:hypothetical protein